MNGISSERAIRSVVATAVKTYANAFSERHLSELNDPDGTINMKINNIFIAELGPEIQYFSALSRSLDSSLGNMLRLPSCITSCRNLSRVNCTPRKLKRSLTCLRSISATRKHRRWKIMSPRSPRASMVGQ